MNADKVRSVAFTGLLYAYHEAVKHKVVSELTTKVR
jgi:hypothetical protein